MQTTCCYRNASGGRCNSKHNIREVEFRHPDYKDLSEDLFLCDSHFTLIFGQSKLTVEHILPLEEEEYLRSRWISAKKKYQKDLEDIREKVRVGVGSEFFDWDTWKFYNGNKVSRAFERYKELRKSTCRFEWCDLRVTSFRKAYVIRVYPRNPNDYINLLFCCLNHWEVYKKRIGLATIKGDLNPEKKRPIITLGDYI